MSNLTQLSKPIESAHRFLDEVYDSLGYREGNLLDAIQFPRLGSNEAEQWLEYGEWLSTAQKVNASKVFFVKNDPVIIFSVFEQDPTDELEVLNLFRRVWCMARPQRLFLALPGELRVYGLNQPPTDDEGQRAEPLVTVNRVADVFEKLQAYRREHLESGYLPEDDRFGKPDERADRRLIQDLKAVRKSLIDDAGLSQEHAHALIGRSIFIRYLEDRGVLTSEYFERIAENRPDWLDLLSQVPEKPAIIQEDEWEKRRYYRVLRDKDFTYALFGQLADDFNGDLFPKDEAEEEEVKQSHLELLRGFLLGDTDQRQPSLFFWAYDFEIIPIELISSIYEEFYHKGQKDEGTHYTPSVLVEFILSQVLTQERLASNPKILDPACGSGIFLVESFRRIVRYQVQARGQPLSAIELRQILRDQIRGIEIDQGAAYVAAFSLYLALLHYQEPPDILAQIEMSDPDSKPLPHLLFDEQQPRGANHYHILFNMNAFALMDAEREQLKHKLDTSPRFKGRADMERLCESPGILPMEPKSFDIVVGNPPWGFIREASSEIQEAQRQAREWCDVFGWSIGDNELSQAFIARTLSLLKLGGVCGFLVSTGIFLKHHENSQRFRQRWLEESAIKTVVNFVHVRKAFFSDAIAPFAFVHYRAGPANLMHWVHYWSAKKLEVVDRTQAVILSLPDLRQVRQSDLKRNEQLWKVYWWGNHRDAALVNALNLNKPLEQFADKDEKGQPIAGRGFEGDFPTGDHNPSGWLKEQYKELPTTRFQRYGPFDPKSLIPVPDLVHRFGERAIYHGWRLLVKRGISQRGVHGQIEARLDEESYCFRNSIHGIKVSNLDEWQRKVLIGILWSSLARYYFFMTASSWGTWHHEIHLSEMKSLPIRFPDDLTLRQRIVQIVDELRNWDPARLGSLSPDSQRDKEIAEQLTLFDHGGLKDEETAERLASLEQQLDEAIFDLYELSEPERDLVQDICKVGLEFFYRHTESRSAQEVEPYPRRSQGIIDDLPNRERERGLDGYLYAFLQMWNDELDGGEFRWRVIRPTNNPMLAIVFTTQDKGSSLPEVESTDDEEWTRVLERCSEVSRQPISRDIYVDGMVRAVTDTEVFIIKRNERRLWTRSLAREDAEATLLQAMYLQEVKQK
jgi:hypothetical protein